MENFVYVVHEIRGMPDPLQLTKISPYSVSYFPTGMGSISGECGVVTLPTIDGGDARTGSTIARMEDLLENILDALAQNTELELPFQRRRHAYHSESRTGRNNTRRGLLCFPGRNGQESRKFGPQHLHTLQADLPIELD
jgi:hypothetical protein